MTVVVPFTNEPAYTDSEFELTARQRPRPRKKTLDSLAKARHHLRRNLPPIPSNRTGRGQDGEQYGWADLEQVDAIVWPFLDAYGLSWETAPDTSPVTGKPCLRWRITHLDTGESDTGTMPIRDGHPQDQGTAFTYAQRYALVIVSGAVVEKGDNDCARSAAKPAKAEQPRTQTPPQVSRQRVDEWTHSILGLRTAYAAQRALRNLRSQRIDTERCEVDYDTRVEHGLPVDGPVTLADLAQAVEISLHDQQDTRRGIAPVDGLPPEPTEEDPEPSPDEDDTPDVEVPAARPAPVDDDPFVAIAGGLPAEHPEHPEHDPSPTG